MIRSFRGTDVVALVTSGIGSLSNEARTRDRIGKRGTTVRPLDKIVQPWFSLERNCTGLYLEQGKIRALASARQRSGDSAWEVDHLLLNVPEREEDICFQLLEHLSEVASRGVERLFLRLDADSPLINPARKAGFFPYITEALYCLNASGISFSSEPLPPRCMLLPGTEISDLALYRLYQAAVPERVQQIEGATLREWSDGHERRERRGRKEFVLVREDIVVAWMQVVSEGPLGRIDLLARPQENEALRATLLNGLALLEGRGDICCLIADYQEELHSLLMAENFIKIARYCVMAKQMALRVRQPRLVPAAL